MRRRLLLLLDVGNPARGSLPGAWTAQSCPAGPHTLAKVGSCGNQSLRWICQARCRLLGWPGSLHLDFSLCNQRPQRCRTAAAGTGNRAAQRPGGRVGRRYSPSGQSGPPARKAHLSSAVSPRGSFIFPLGTPCHRVLSACPIHPRSRAVTPSNGRCAAVAPLCHLSPVGAVFHGARRNVLGPRPVGTTSGNELVS